MDWAMAYNLWEAKLLATLQPMQFRCVRLLAPLYMTEREKSENRSSTFTNEKYLTKHLALRQQSIVLQRQD